MSSSLPRSVVIAAEISSGAGIGLGLSLLAFPHFTLSNPMLRTLATILSIPPPPEVITDAVAQTAAVAGVCLTGFCSLIGLALYHGYDEPIYLHVPAGLIISDLAALVWLLKPDAISPLLVDIMLVDGIIAAFLGWKLGSWTGAKPGLSLGK